MNRSDERGCFHDRYLITPAREVLMTNSFNGWNRFGVTFVSIPYGVYRAEAEQLWAPGSGQSHLGRARPRGFLMPVRPGGDSSLSPEARETVWRIFGAGASPGARRSVFDNIEPMIRKHVPPAGQDRAIATIGDWFESGAHVRWLKPDRAGLVADLVIEGVGPRRSEDAVWAIGSVGLDLSAGKIKGRWAAGEIRTLVDAAVDLLNQAKARVRYDDRSAGSENAEFVSFPGGRIPRRDRGRVRAARRRKPRTGESGTAPDRGQSD